MKKSKIFTILLLVLAPASIAYAALFDTETSKGNTFSATTLDIEFYTIEKTSFRILPGIPVVLPSKVRNTGNLTNENSQQYVYISGDQTLASKIQLTVFYKTGLIYSGNLSDYNISNFTDLNPNKSAVLIYTFYISLDDIRDTRGTQIDFQIKDIAQQEDITYPNGFNDTESIHFTIINPKKVLNLNTVEILQTDQEVTVPTPVDILMDENNLNQESNE